MSKEFEESIDMIAEIAGAFEIEELVSLLHLAIRKYKKDPCDDTFYPLCHACTILLIKVSLRDGATAPEIKDDFHKYQMFKDLGDLTGRKQ